MSLNSVRVLLKAVVQFSKSAISVIIKPFSLTQENLSLSEGLTLLVYILK